MSTVYQTAFKELAKTDVIHAMIIDITNPKFFRALYALSMLCFLLSDHCTIVIRVSHAWTRFFLTHCATKALEHSKEFLNDEDLFNSEDDHLLETEAADVYGNASGQENE